MAVDGVVREWDDETGCGVVDADPTPGGCWVHFSMVAVSGFRSLRPGQAVRLEFEELDFLQDGYPFRGVRVWPAGQDPEPDPGRPSIAYRSTLTITVDGEPWSSRQPGPADVDPGGQ